MTDVVTHLSLGRAIAQLRERRGLTQADCASALGVAQATWCRWETGEREPDLASLCQIADLLGAAILIDGDGIRLVPAPAAPAGR